MSFIDAPPLSEEEFPAFAAIREKMGFLPNFFRAQTSRTDLITAQLGLIESIVDRTGALQRRQKEYIFLAVSARNLSTYCVTAHCEIVKMLKIEGPEPEQIALDHNHAKLPMAEKALLNFTVKLNGTPTAITQDDIDALRTFGFTDQHIMEAVVVTGLAQYANTVSFGLGTAPDFDNPRTNFQAKSA